MHADFTCPHCAVAHAKIEALEARTPIRRVFRHLALSRRDPRAVPLACAVEAAGRQGAFWPFHDALYADQAHTDDPHLWALAKTLGLDLARFDADRRSDAVATRVAAQTKAAIRAGATSTPAVSAPPGLYP